MDFGEAVQLIVDRVKRPDKTEDIKAAINRAIGLFAVKNWAHDIVELTHTIVATDYAQSFDITAVPFERFRKIKYIRPTGFRKYLSWRDPSRIFQPNGAECLDVWYRSGNNIVFKLSKLQPTLEIAYYQYHLAMIADDDTDWMLDQVWPALHDYVTGNIHGEIGNDQERARYESKGMLLLDAFHADIGDSVAHS